MSEKNNSAKFAFFYILSLVALVFVALSVGMVIFQIINKELVDLINEYSGNYSDGAMRFAISAIIIATPIYYITTKQIFKNLYSGELDRESGIRKWLSYLILLVAVVVMIGWLIATINSFLGGELTSKAILKTVTALFISGGVFSFYLYDIRREDVVNHKDKVIKIYSFASLVIILAVFVLALMTVDSPQEIRKKKMDDRVINSYYQIDNSLNDYYNSKGNLPESLEILQDNVSYLTDENLVNPITGEKYEYKIVADDKYELCTTFQSSNKENSSADTMYQPAFDKQWLHDAGYQCLSQKVMDYNNPPKDVKVIR